MSYGEACDFGTGMELPAAPPRPVFRETPRETAERLALGVAWSLRPPRIAGLPGLCGLHLRNWLWPAQALPDPALTLRRLPDVAGIAADLSVPTLVAAYARGLYPLSHVLQPKWQSPQQRCVLFYRDFHISRRLRAHIRQQRFRVSFDRDFAGVMRACAERRGRRRLTWITPRIMRAFSDLHDAGQAHSFEVWDGQGALVGGGYGVTAGGSFAVESMFCREDNASKVGFAVLNWHLAHWGYAFTDQKTPALYKEQCGFRMIPRGDFLAHLRAAVAAPPPRHRWEVCADAASVAAWRPAEAPVP